jgi:abortive infection bacteriophage resistance protein
VFTSWLQTINVVRNICAHHCRLWNRQFGVKPLLPNEHKYPDWHKPVRINQSKVFGLLTILRYFLTIIAPQSRWRERLFVLLEEYSEIERSCMGFPNNWQKLPLWL